MVVEVRSAARRRKALPLGRAVLLMHQSAEPTSLELSPDGAFMMIMDVECFLYTIPGDEDSRRLSQYRTDGHRAHLRGWHEELKVWMLILRTARSVALLCANEWSR